MFQRSKRFYVGSFLVSAVFGGWVFFGGGNPQFSFSEEIRYHSGDRRDPFVPVNRNLVVGAKESDFKVDGIIFDVKGHSIAVVNGAPCRVGDSVGEHKIIAIDANKVIAELKGKQTEYWISTAERDFALAEKNKGM